MARVGDTLFCAFTHDPFDCPLDHVAMAGKWSAKAHEFQIAALRYLSEPDEFEVRRALSVAYLCEQPASEPLDHLLARAIFADVMRVREGASDPVEILVGSADILAFTAAASDVFDDSDHSPHLSRS